MDNTSSTSSIDFALLNQAINRYVPIPLLLFGIIGTILNILIFTRKTFHNNVCVAYFLASSIFDSFAIIFGLIPRLLNGFNIDPSQTSAVVCKLRFFITYSAGYAAAWFISFACVERYLTSSTSAYKRQLITMKRAYSSMVIVILIGFLAFGEVFYCVDINQQLLGAPQSCYQLKEIVQCQLVDSLMQFIFEILAPTLVMVVFGFLMLRNVRNRRHRVNPEQKVKKFIPLVAMSKTSNHSMPQQLAKIATSTNKQSLPTDVNRTIQKRDAQLATMLLVQVAVIVIFTFPISVYKLYAIATMNMTKSVLSQSIESTIFNVSVISLFLNNSITFYIYTLCGAVFRKELMKLFRLAN